MEEKLYRNSLNYVPIDVAKGIDRITGKRVNADEIDPNYERMPKCMHCENFTKNEEKIGLGMCNVGKKPFIAYPDMAAITCEWYKDK